MLWRVIDSRGARRSTFLAALDAIFFQRPALFPGLDNAAAAAAITEPPAQGAGKQEQPEQAVVRKRGTVPAENPAADANIKRQRQEESELSPEKLAQLPQVIEAEGAEEGDAHDMKEDEDVNR